MSKPDESHHNRPDCLEENNQALSSILQISAQDLPLNTILLQILDVLLSLSWLSILPEGGIFLTQKNRLGNDELKLVVERNLSEQIVNLCATVPFGHCLCGKVAETKLPFYASCIDERHVTIYDGIAPHGHYNIPILSGNELVGVLVLYLPHGKQRDEEEIAFISRVTGVISLTIELHRKEVKLKNVVRELGYQKSGLDQHAIVSITDPDGNISYVNDKFCHLSGYSRSELVGKNHRILKSNEHDAEFYKKLWGTLLEGNSWHGELKNKSKDGEFYWLNSTIVPFLDSNKMPYQFLAISTNISKQKSTEEAYARAQCVANIGNWCLDLRKDILTWSDQIFEIFGLNIEEFTPSFAAFLGITHPDDVEYVGAQYQKSIYDNLPYDVEHRIIRQDSGEVRWVHEKCVHHRNEDGVVIRSDGTVQDITERKMAEKNLHDAEQRLRLATETAHIGIWEWHLKSNALSWNTQMYSLFGIDPNIMKNVDYKTWKNAVLPEDLTAQEKSLKRTISSRRNTQSEYRIRRYDNGETRIIQSYESVRIGEDGHAEAVIGSCRDITQQRLSEEKIERLAMIDQLTGLANRNMFNRRFDESIKLAARENRILGLVLLDLDKFKPVNDDYGHLVGDGLLKHVAKIFVKHCRETDIVARIGGDEFAILLIHPENADAIGKWAQRIIDEVRKPMTISGHIISIGVSIGISIYPDHSERKRDLFHRADLALYESKRGGRNQFHFYHKDLEDN